MENSTPDGYFLYLSMQVWFHKRILLFPCSKVE
jgi:hypothetical protein